MKKLFSGIFGGLNTGSIIIMMVLCFIALASHFLGWRTDSGDMLLMGMAVLTQGNTLQDILKWEQDNMHSRDVVTVLSGQDLALGAVVGKITKSTPTTGTADAGNTGGGTAASVIAGLKAKLGEYQIKCLTYVASPLAATFEVTDPDGNLLPEATLAAYTSDQINFDIADGSPAITVGDIWTITVADGSGKIKEIDFDAVDGTQNAHGFLIAAVDASAADVNGVAIVRDATIVTTDLVWPTTSPAVTAAQKTAALAELAVKGIIAVSEV
ncbi:MAG: head decoration protein [Holophaga sp.]|nr:head decoration protein [Holophaga sp.]